MKYSVYENKKGHICGGSIIGSKHVLTAAHCVVNKMEQFIDDTFNVVGGISDLTSTDDTKIVIKVARIYILRKFRPMIATLITGRGIADIAVLKLESELPFSTNPKLATLKLAEQEDNHYLTYAQNRANISGFGLEIRPSLVRNTNQRQYLSNQIKFAQATILAEEDCQSVFGLSYKIGKEQLCARVDQINPSHPSGACKGDSGGALVFNGDTAVGMLSNIAHDCNEQYFVAIYARITAFKYFIEEAMQDRPNHHMRLGIYEAGKVQELHVG